MESLAMWLSRFPKCGEHFCSVAQNRRCCWFVSNVRFSVRRHHSRLHASDIFPTKLASIAVNYGAELCLAQCGMPVKKFRIEKAEGQFNRYNYAH